MDTITVFNELSAAEQFEWDRQKMEEVMNYHTENIEALTAEFRTRNKYSSSEYLNDITVQIRALVASQNGYKSWGEMMEAHGSIEGMEDGKKSMQCQTMGNFNFIAE